MAIQIPGQRRYARAVPAFQEMINGSPDAFMPKEIVTARARIDTFESRQLRECLRNHPFPVIRKAYDEATRHVSQEGVHDEIYGQAREMPIQNRMRHVRIFAHTAGMSMMTSPS